MNKVIFIFSISLLVFSNSCGNTHNSSDDVACLKTVNKDISKELRKELGDRYDSIKGDIKLIMKFYVRKNGYVDSIVFVKSNLPNVGVNEELIRNNLMKKEYKCIWDVYYGKKIKPDNVTVIFNPRLDN